MAHIGKFGPFAFRRDFNLNYYGQLEYQWYQAYIFTPPAMPPGEAQPIQGKSFPTMAETYPAFDTIHWPGKLTRAGLFFYKFEMKCQVIRDKYLIEGALFESGFGLIWHWHYVLLFFDHWIPQPYLGKTPVTDFYSTDWFSTQPNVGPVQPRLWSDGPPPT